MSVKGQHGRRMGSVGAVREGRGKACTRHVQGMYKASLNAFSSDPSTVSVSAS